MESEEPTELRPTPFGEYLGVEIVRAAEGECEIRLELTDGHRNRRGVAHGGVSSALLDMALGGAVVSTLAPEEWCGTLEISVQFRDPARRSPLTGRGRVARRGRRLAFAEGEVVDARGRVVAAAHGVWTIWPRHPDGKQEPAP